MIDEDVRERLEYIPAKMLVHELHYLKRACGKCKETVKVAPPPPPDHPAAALTKGSRYGFGVTAQIILGKYADHLPLYRLEDVFARAGVVIPRSTQVGLLDAAADLLTPLTDLMRSKLLTSPVIGMDDTPVQLPDPSLPGKMGERMWLARSNVCGGNDEDPYSVFFFHKSRAQGKGTREGPSGFLGHYRGWATVDAYGVYDGVYLGREDRVLASCCIMRMCVASLNRPRVTIRSVLPHLCFIDNCSTSRMSVRIFLRKIACDIARKNRVR